MTKPTIWMRMNRKKKRIFWLKVTIGKNSKKSLKRKQNHYNIMIINCYWILFKVSPTGLKEISIHSFDFMRNMAETTLIKSPKKLRENPLKKSRNIPQFSGKDPRNCKILTGSWHKLKKERLRSKEEHWLKKPWMLKLHDTGHLSINYELLMAPIR